MIIIHPIPYFMTLITKEDSSTTRKWSRSSLNENVKMLPTHYVHVEKKAEANMLLSRVRQTAIKWRYKRADIPRVGSDAKLPWRWRSGWWTVGGGDLWRSKRERDNTLKAGRVNSSTSQHLWVQRCHSVWPGRRISNTNRCLWLVEG